MIDATGERGAAAGEASGNDVERIEEKVAGDAGDRADRGARLPRAGEQESVQPAQGQGTDITEIEPRRWAVPKEKAEECPAARQGEHQVEIIPGAAAHPEHIETQKRDCPAPGGEPVGVVAHVESIRTGHDEKGEGERPCEGGAQLGGSRIHPETRRERNPSERQKAFREQARPGTDAPEVVPGTDCGESDQKQADPESRHPTGPSQAKPDTEANEYSETAQQRHPPRTVTRGVGARDEAPSQGEQAQKVVGAQRSERRAGQQPRGGNREAHGSFHCPTGAQRGAGVLRGGSRRSAQWLRIVSLRS